MVSGSGEGGGDNETETQGRVALSKQKHVRKGFPGNSKCKGGRRRCLRNRPVQPLGNEQGVCVCVLGGGVCVCVCVCVCGWVDVGVCGCGCGWCVCAHVYV